MPYEVSKKLMRVTLARLSDNANHANGANGVDRSRDHGADGTFVKGNRAAQGTGAKRAAKHLVPRRGWRVYEALCSQLGADGGTLAYLHAGDAVRHYIAAGELGELARVAGLATPEGKDLDERSTRHAEAGLRAATAAMDAARLFRRPGVTKRRAKATPPGFEATE
jgi:hypothetical protein